MNITNKQALVTGATGFIGGYLAQRLQTSAGVQVRALARTPAKAQGLAALGVEVVQGDITAAESVQRAMADCDIVFHAAAWADEQGDKQAVRAVNVGGTQHVVDAAVAAGVERFVHVSSCAVYGSLQQMEIDETIASRKTGRVYHDSKVEAEEVVFRAYDDQALPVVVARPSQVYGPGSPQFTLRVLESVQAGKVILIDGGKHFMKPVYIDNLVDALVLCAQVDAAVGEALNLSDGAPLPWGDYFAAFGEMADVQAFRSAPYAAAWLFGLYKEIESSVRGKRSSLNREVVKTFRSHNSFSNAKARMILGWEPQIDFEEGMRRTEAWLREQGHLPSGR